MSEIILPKESYELMSVLFEVHNELGPIYKEKDYADTVERKLILKSIPYFRERKLSEFFPNVNIKALVPDFVIRMCIIFDAKAWRRIKDEDVRQMCRYLDQSGLPLGIVANFRRQKLEYKRIINPKRDKVRWP
ncbi:GxxExxY protein [Patescibacteria group bacterium]|nr:GxxExxY protein [Patescibacteria group bacterium]MBU4512848.1 GxxExxY protein [Patescibacteria group bacterium]MCG2693623.1 GxxExxY protein [Candidatus Parcubacteria bacterium]